jgi:hypothetical protein
MKKNNIILALIDYIGWNILMRRKYGKVSWYECRYRLNPAKNLAKMAG